jgi:hypothetical protein
MCVKTEREVTVYRFEFPRFWEGYWETYTQTTWCCSFNWVHEVRYGLIARLTACEEPNRYAWWAFAVGFGSGTYYDRQICFKKEPSRVGSCSRDDAPTS